MNIDEILKTDHFSSDNELKNLLLLMQRLKLSLDKLSLEKFNRINPLAENLFDWKSKGKFITGKDNITVYDSSTIVGNVEIGENTWIGPFTNMDGTGGLKIGKGCSVSSGVNITTHDSVRWALSGGKAGYEYGKVEIGDHCFIGTNAFISKGITIGKHCLIGAGAVVTKNVPDYSIVLGVPAKICGKVLIKEGEVKLIFDKE